MKSRPTAARMPISSATRATVAGSQYMSLKKTVPPRIISTMASRVAQATSSGVSRASAGQMCFSSQGKSSMSSAKPRKSVMAAWPCAL